MMRLVAPAQRLPAEGMTGQATLAEQQSWAEGQRQLRELHYQQHAGLLHLLATLEFKRDDAAQRALEPAATEHQRGQAFALNELVKQVGAILLVTEK